MISYKANMESVTLREGSCMFHSVVAAIILAAQGMWAVVRNNILGLVVSVVAVRVACCELVMCDLCAVRW